MTEEEIDEASRSCGYEESYSGRQHTFDEEKINAFKLGVKFAKSKMYSEEDMKEAYKDGMRAAEQYTLPVNLDPFADTWFKTVKKINNDNKSI